MIVRPRLRALVLAVSVSAVSAVTLSAAPAASALPPMTVVATDDYATETFGDPWDFSNPEDVLLDGGVRLEEGGPTVGMRNAAIHGGMLSFDMSSQGYLSPVWGGYPGGLYLGREAGAPERQVDASKYTRLSIHMYASQAAPAGIQWFGCPGLDTECWGGQPFLARQGWNTYNITLKNQGYGLPQEWEGMITGLRLALSPSSQTSYKIDWMRLYEPSVTAPPALRGGQWDVNDTGSDNVAHRSGWGNVNCLVEVCDLGFLPAGQYFVRDTPSSEHTGPLRVLRPARPVVLDPDEVGGAEHAADNPWDFADMTDVGYMGNAQLLEVGDRLLAQNTGPIINDPHVWLPLRTPTIDPYRFHRLTVRSGYEGPFDLRDIEGGGTMGRLIWQTVDDQTRVQQTNDLVTYEGTRTLTVDLTDAALHETDGEAGGGRDWQSTSEISGIRWDPNEDRGPRRWWLERVALRADDEAGSSFDIRWYDAGYAPGSTVRIYAQDDEKGTNRTLISGSQPLEQRPGTNVFTWNTSNVRQGWYHVYVEVSGDAGTAGSVSTGPVHVVGGFSGQAPSPATPLVRSLTDACPQSRVPGAELPDVPSGSLHAPGIDCIAWWGVTTPAGRYVPTGPVTRGQMASFLQRVIERTGGPLPAGGNAFPDDDASIHQPAINALAAAGVVGGYSDGLYRPDEPVNRAQMATFLMRAAERVGGPLPRSADFFLDDNGDTHESSIDKAAGTGVAGGTDDEEYSPKPQVRRDQMASFLARLLDLLVSAGHGAPPVR